MTAPIALFVYRRPGHARRAVDALKGNTEAMQSPLHIFSDGAGSAEHEAAVREVREYIRGIDGFASVTIVERERNLGLADSIVDGVTQLCNEYGRIIVVEDDLVVSCNFLNYMNRALDRYADKEQVMQVAGHMFPVALGKMENDAIFLPIITSWGWATWQRAWKDMKRGRQLYDWIAACEARRREFNANGSFPYFDMLEKNVEGIISSWAIEWYASVFRRQGMTLFPVRTLVENTGDEDATHHARPEFWMSQSDPDFLVTTFPEPRLNLRAFRSLERYFRSVDRNNSGIRRYLQRAISRLTALTSHRIG